MAKGRAKRRKNDIRSACLGIAAGEERFSAPPLYSGVANASIGRGGGTSGGLSQFTWWLLQPLCSQAQNNDIQSNDATGDFRAGFACFDDGADAADARSRH